MTWLKAFETALNKRWPGNALAGIVELRRVLDSVPFTAPEVLSGPVSRAWEVYLKHGDDSPVGRAAVALAYAIQAQHDDWKCRVTALARSLPVPQDPGAIVREP